MTCNQRLVGGIHKKRLGALAGILVFRGKNKYGPGKYHYEKLLWAMPAWFVIRARDINACGYLEIESNETINLCLYTQHSLSFTCSAIK